MMLGDLPPGVFLFPRTTAAADLAPAIETVTAAAPFRKMVTPGGGVMSVAMTNCGAWGWVTDRKGYRYTREDPETGRPWPAMPPLFQDLARRAAARAGFEGFDPDACLVNCYDGDSRMGLHQDRDERDFTQPIVSVSLGSSATFLLGGPTRTGPTAKLRLEDGDVLVFGGPARRIFHGVRGIEAGNHPVLGNRRINLTFRRAR